MKCLHPLGMSCGSCKLDARVYTTTTSEVSKQELSPIAQLEIYKKGIAWERARIASLIVGQVLYWTDNKGNDHHPDFLVDIIEEEQK